MAPDTLLLLSVTKDNADGTKRGVRQKQLCPPAETRQCRDEERFEDARREKKRSRLDQLREYQSQARTRRDVTLPNIILRTQWPQHTADNRQTRENDKAARVLLKNQWLPTKVGYDQTAMAYLLAAHPAKADSAL